jgi:hypothetical protein
MYFHTTHGYFNFILIEGFGNFSYYYIRQDFSAQRFLQMMWRLNFFVVLVCVALNNEYMLYYINPMHTLFTLMVFGVVATKHEWNLNDKVIWLKLAFTMALCFVLWDINDGGPMMILSRPFTFLLEFHDPLHPKFDELHEWQFRTGLDHYIWVFGMFCAFTHPALSRFLHSLDDDVVGSHQFSGRAKKTLRFALGAIAVIPFVVWAFTIFQENKYEYNSIHPYTSFIPIGCFIILRNFTPTMRSWYMHLYATAGKVTLETYILQFHVWMKTTGINGSPKHLLALLPPQYYWLNFIATSALFIGMSYRIFHLTMVLRDVFIPKKDFTFRKVKS